MSSTFAAPLPPIGDGMFDTDFRTVAGNDYESVNGGFGIDGLPKGMINRTPYNSPFVPMNKDSWSSAVAQLIYLPADIDLWIDTLNFNSATNMVTTTIKAAIVHEVPTSQNLTIYLTEDHIFDWQIDNRLPLGQQNIENYEFRHVLRGALNNSWGEAFIPADAQAGDTLEFTHTYPLPANVLVPDNCSLVAYVYNNAGANQYEVQQATERKFTP